MSKKNVLRRERILKIHQSTILGGKPKLEIFTEKTMICLHKWTKILKTLDLKGSTTEDACLIIFFRFLEKMIID